MTRLSKEVSKPTRVIVQTDPRNHTIFSAPAQSINKLASAIRPSTSRALSSTGAAADARPESLGLSTTLNRSRCSASTHGTPWLFEDTVYASLSQKGLPLKPTFARKPSTQDFRCNREPGGGMQRSEPPPGQPNLIFLLRCNSPVKASFYGVPSHCLRQYRLVYVKWYSFETPASVFDNTRSAALETSYTPAIPYASSPAL